MSTPLLAAVTDLVALAADRARSQQARESLRRSHDRLTGPLRVALAGRIKAGKSTLLNALLGADLAASDAGECTRIPTWYSWGDEPSVTLYDAAGRDRPGRFAATSPLTVALDAGEVDRIELRWPAEALRDITFVDTPGLASLSAEVSDRTVRALTPGGAREPAVDAVVYLLRHTHSTDLRFLEAFGDDDLARSGPVNTVGVLSRADEIGSARLDAMSVAGRIADRYAQDPRLRRVCPVVVPVDGLLAAGAGTLTGAERRALQTISSAPGSETAALLLTADRLVARASAIAVPPDMRRRLVGRLGLFGVRLAVELLRSGTPDLRAALRTASGLDRLRTVLTTQFRERADLLKARSALALVTALLDADACADRADLRDRLERIMAGAHAFSEIRLLDQLRDGEIRLTETEIVELQKLLGGSGHAPADRLGRPDADPADVRGAAEDALRRWRARAEHPLASRSAREAAAVAQRTLEGILAARPGQGPE